MEMGAVTEQSSALLNTFLHHALLLSGRPKPCREGAGAERGWSEQGPRCGGSLWLAQGAVSVCPGSASPAMSSRPPALPGPFGNALSQPASPGLLWQRLTLKNQLCSCL